MIEMTYSKIDNVSSQLLLVIFLFNASFVL